MRLVTALTTSIYVHQGVSGKGKPLRAYPKVFKRLDRIGDSL